jgi:hypothetical protein
MTDSTTPPRQAAIDLLLRLLETGPVPATEIMAHGERVGISPRTMKRAKSALAVTSRKEGQVWLWSIEEGHHEECQPVSTVPATGGGEVLLKTLARTWEPGLPFTCACGFETGWRRGDVVACPSCDYRQI